MNQPPQAGFGQAGTPPVAPRRAPVKDLRPSHGSGRALPEQALCPYEDAPRWPVAQLLQGLFWALPAGHYRRALVLEAGSGALGIHVPATCVVLAESARPLLARAQKRLLQRPDRQRFVGLEAAPTQVPALAAGAPFDLVIYDQLRAKAPLPAPLLEGTLASLLRPGGILLLGAPASLATAPLALTALGRTPVALAPSLGPGDLPPARATPPAALPAFAWCTYLA